MNSSMVRVGGRLSNGSLLSTWMIAVMRLCPSIEILRVGGLLTIVCVAGGCKPAPPPPVPPNTEFLEPQLRKYVQQHIDAVRADPSKLAAQAELGLVYEANAMWMQAKVSFENVLQLAPDHPLALHHLAIVYSHIGELDTAVKWLRHTVKLHPALGPAWHRLGHMCLDRGDTICASDAFETVIALAPGEPVGCVSLGAARLAQGELVQAETLLKRGIAMAPSYRLPHFLLGQCYMRMGRAEEATRELTLGTNGHIRFLADEWSKRLRRHSQTLTAQLKKARTLYGKGDASGAAKILEGAIAWHPNNVDALNNLAIAYMSGNRAAEALTLLQRAEQVDPTDAFTYTNLALCRLQRKEFEQALALADRAVSLAPQSADAHLTRGRILLQHRRPFDAVGAFAKSVEHDPENLTARIALANTYFGMKDFERAKDQYRAALEKSPGLIPAMVRFAEACIHTADFDEARRTITQLERIGGANEDVRRAVESLRARMGG